MSRVAIGYGLPNGGFWQDANLGRCVAETTVMVKLNTR